MGSVTRRVRFKCRGNGDTKVRLVPKRAKPTTWPAVYQSRKQIRTHLDPSDSVSKDLREGELKKKKRKFRTKSLTVDREQTDPHFFFFFAQSHISASYISQRTCSSSSPAALCFWHRGKVADVQEIQEYLWKNPIFHNYGLARQKQNYNVRKKEQQYTSEKADSVKRSSGGRDGWRNVGGSRSPQ